MDDLDRRLIAKLRHDARAPVADLAKALGVARGTITNRMARLSSTNPRWHPGASYLGLKMSASDPKVPRART